MDFEAGRAAVVATAAPDAVVGRWPGLLCVAEGGDPATLARLLELCAAAAAEPAPIRGRALARRLAMWLGADDGPDDRLRFGTLAVAGDRWAVFLSGAVELVLPDGGPALSGAQSAAWTDRLLAAPDGPVALVLEGAVPPADAGTGVHDLRLGVVPGAGVVLAPAGGALAGPHPLAAEPARSARDAVAPARPAPAEQAPARRQPAAARAEQAADAAPVARPRPATRREPAPAADRPAAESPATDRPAADRPAADRPAADRPAGDRPAERRPAADRRAAGRPAADRPAAPEPAATPAAAGSGDTADGTDGAFWTSTFVPGSTGMTSFSSWTAGAEELRAELERAAEKRAEERRARARRAGLGGLGGLGKGAGAAEPPADRAAEEAANGAADGSGGAPPAGGGRHGEDRADADGSTGAPAHRRPESGAGAEQAPDAAAGTAPPGVAAPAGAVIPGPSATGAQPVSRSGSSPAASPVTPPPGSPSADPGVPAPRRSERIDGVAPVEPPRTPLEAGEPAGAQPEKSTTVLTRPQAQGHLCARGHLNDPRSHFCVLCGIRMNERTNQLVVGSRPPLGLLVFDDGSTYTVDAEYLVGRMPEADQRVRSGVLRAIIIEDRSGSVSRVHAEVRLNGWDVMLVDSGSRNGTYVSGPGETGWTALPPHQSRRLVPGTRIRLGARNFAFESPSGVR